MPQLPPRWEWSGRTAVHKGLGLSECEDTLDETARAAWAEWEAYSGITRNQLEAAEPLLIVQSGRLSEETTAKIRKYINETLNKSEAEPVELVEEKRKWNVLIPISGAVQFTMPSDEEPTYGEAVDYHSENSPSDELEWEYMEDMHGEGNVMASHMYDKYEADEMKE